jgi:hypothetical protein
MYGPFFAFSCMDLGITGLNFGMIMANDIKTPMFWYVLFFTGLFGLLGKLGIIRKGLIKSLPC